MRRAIIQLAIRGALGLCAHVAHSQSATADRLTYTTFQRPSNWDIYLFQGSGQSPRRLTADPSLDYDPVVSPDGRWLVFCSSGGGTPIYTCLISRLAAGSLVFSSIAILEDQACFRQTHGRSRS